VWRPKLLSVARMVYVKKLKPTLIAKVHLHHNNLLLVKSYQASFHGQREAAEKP
jgi:hypothetical protein